jgi:MFS superfamily sulfate permease-like transporter
VAQRSVHIRSDSPLAWILGVLVLGVVIVLAFFFLTFLIVAVAVAAVAAPVLVWWRKRKLRHTGRRVIDAEYEISPKKAEE